ncbi:hypothetical protein AOL_s00007g348 [Orbilia oligospora ATCC 24927]|uniref:Uncharacterized protein n=2 Tax=Orbilia oligospora TaxID=2813651 RepID=G1X239_ARTOA|nr:hypothetical protein AOL_s00007g348 [Orbilia oligospora ATCC 24927]EGX53012.1 hypothetical protein AOL_s00007g348 [Orbilia oligospora ATCC 24927]KAF3277519.1 hypothetical protein TWF970_005127 [Orbilia oligospora]
MQFFTTILVALSLASAAIAAPHPVSEPIITRITNTDARIEGPTVTRIVNPGVRTGPPTVTRITTPTCITRFTVTTSYPPKNQRYTTTIYKTWAAIPHDLDCKGCNLDVITKTINTSRRPDATVTRESTLTRVPMCYFFPTPRP